MKSEGTLISCLLVMFIPTTEAVTAQDGCKTEIVNNETIVNCSHRNLSCVPKTTHHVTNLIFSYNNLRNISSITFKNISDPDSLTDLSLDNNVIQNISKRSFSVFQNLEHLNLSSNPIDYDNMKNLLGELSNLKFLSHLGMGRIRTITIQKDLFSLMTPNMIEVLDVRFNHMETVFIDTFKTLNNLKVLYLRDNQIENIHFSKNDHLRHLYVDYNKLGSFPNFSVNGSEKNCYLSNLQILSLGDNDIKEIGIDHLKCLTNLNQLRLNRNPIKVLPSNFLSKLPRLATLELKSFSTGTLKIEPLAFKSSSLRILRLNFFQPARAVFVSFKETFRYLPNLRSLSLGLISMMQVTDDQFSDLFSPLTKITTFECFACQISRDPKIILKYMKHVVYISLHSSQITKLSAQTFEHNKQLRHLDLRFNYIAHIPETALPKSLLDNLESLDLSHNPFTCDCDLQWFIDWMKSNGNKRVIQRYPGQYICSLPPSKSKMRLSEISYTYKECHPWSPWVWFAIVASPCVIVIGLTTIVLYRNRWNTKHYIYLMRKRRRYQILNGHNLVYDAFVGYEAEDSAWVRRRLLPVLEEQNGFKLCIHERDFKAGVFINDNIVTNMDKSAKIVLVLTNAFARSAWCTFELKVAHSKLIEDGTELVVVLLEKIDGRNMNHSLKVLFDTTTYIEWTEDLVGQELFWEKLKNALKK